jgi:hypothetical protein
LCRAPRSDRLCPECGHDLLAGAPPVVLPPERPAGAATWVAVARADPDYYETANPTGHLEVPRVPFPRDWAPRRFPLAGDRAWIGRRGRTRSHPPEIDLGGWPADPGVSRLHALLLSIPGDGWALLDPGSAEGTTLNDGTEAIPVDVLVSVKDGDRIHLGAWTTISLQRV